MHKGGTMEHSNKLDESRRNFLAGMAGAGALAALGEAATLRAAMAQAAPAGTLSNDAIKADKVALMQWHSERPLTGSLPAHQHDFEFTPNNRMFVRNNLLIPDIDINRHRLTVKGLVEKELSFTAAELQTAFTVVNMAGMLECAGAGRSNYDPKASGTPWLGTGGMGCPVWTGVRLKDVLAAAGLKDKAAHVAGHGGDPGAVATAAPVIRSIPMSKAMDENTLIVWGMNGDPLPKVHGYPLRLLAPGWVGSASTKWLHTLTVLDAPFNGTYMTSSYVAPKWPVKPGEKMPPDTVSIQDWPIKSMITFPAPDQVFKGTETIAVRGKAWVGEGSVARVEISWDEGATWRRATLKRPQDKYAWATFSLGFQPQRFGHLTFLARATDERGNVQPITPYWNPLGYFWNGLDRVGVMVVPA
jgi:sulfite oxidase